MTRTVLLIKPEAIASSVAVQKWLRDRRVICHSVSNYTGFRQILRQIYADEFRPSLLNAFAALYDRHDLCDIFAVLDLSADGDAVHLLCHLKGDFRRYQEVPENTLRGKWGLPARYNGQIGPVTFVLNGIHTPATEAELVRLRTILDRQRNFALL